MIKKYTFLFLTLCALTAPFSQAQTFISVATDPMENPPVHDLKGLYYALDEAQDSLWLRLTFYDTTGGDFGAALAFDTNLVTTDGSTWGGSNSSMNYDLVIYLERNGFFEQDLRSSSTLVNSIVEEDSTVTLNFQFSVICPNGEFNLLAGTGGFDISTTGTVYDDLPDNGYMTIPMAPTGISFPEISEAWMVYPNPASNYIKISGPANTGENTRFHLMSVDGRTVKSWHASNGQQIDVSGIQQGLYLLVKENESGKLVTSQLQVIR